MTDSEASVPNPPGARPAVDNDTVALSRAEYQMLLARLVQMEKNFESLTAEPEPEPEQPKVPPKKKTVIEVVKEKATEQYKVQATGLAASVTSFDLLSKFSLHTAAFIAVVSTMIKLAFATAFTHLHTANCIPSRTVLSGDWPNSTYTSLYNSKSRQYLCNTVRKMTWNDSLV
jgi:hypothetical protein